MIEDAAEGQFDLIITKEISRFARNTLDSIRYTRQLLSCGVGVFFQNDNINTFDEDAELRLSIMSSIAQDELRKLSSRVKFGHQQAIKSSVVLGNSRIFGYTKADGKLAIDETEAPMVRELFELYATAAYLERVTVNNVKNVKNAKKAIEKAFRYQVEGKGFSLIEVLSACPTNWGLTPQKALEWIDEKMIPYYPLGVYRDKEG